MEDKANQDGNDELDQRRGSGSLLAAARKQQNKTVAEIAEELNLSVSQIKTIELDQTDGLPEPTYVRGYIRSYAKLLGLNSEEILQNYLNPNWQQTTRLDDIPRGIGSAEDMNNNKSSMSAKAIALLAIAAVTALLWYSGYLADWFGDGESTTQDGTAMVDESAGSVSVGAASQTIAASSPDASGVSPDAQLENQLVLTFSQTSWVDIRDEADQKLAYKSYAPGETLEVSSPGSMNVFIGNAAGVDVQVNGDEFDTAEHREGVYAKFTVGDE